MGMRKIKRIPDSDMHVPRDRWTACSRQACIPGVERLCRGLHSTASSERRMAMGGVYTIRPKVCYYEIYCESLTNLSNIYVLVSESVRFLCLRQ